MFYQGDEQFGTQRSMDVRQLVFDYQWYDWKGAARDFSWSDDYNRFSKEKHNRSDYIKKDATRIYPDTLVWVRDFTYSYNEPMTRNYFSHPAFDDYPVVGIAWKQANAFAYWRTNLWNGFEEVNTEDFRLPTEHEWEYAARGGHDLAPFPWGGYYVRNTKGCLLANFKPGRGDYPADGGLYTVKADAYFPNDYGLYNMSGNVSEWTSSAFYENAYAFGMMINPLIIGFIVRAIVLKTNRFKSNAGGIKSLFDYKTFLSILGAYFGATLFFIIFYIIYPSTFFCR